MRPLPHFLQSPLLRSVPWVYHAFGGVDPVAGRGHRERLAEAFSVSPEAVGALKQVHSADVLEFRLRDADVPGGWRWRGTASGPPSRNGRRRPHGGLRARPPRPPEGPPGRRGPRGVARPRVGDRAGGRPGSRGTGGRWRRYRPGGRGGPLRARLLLRGGGGSGRGAVRPSGGGPSERRQAGEVVRRPPGDRPVRARRGRDLPLERGGRRSLHGLLKPLPFVSPRKILDRQAVQFNLYLQAALSTKSAARNA